jgi:hypothetical protein
MDGAFLAFIFPKPSFPVVRSHSLPVGSMFSLEGGPRAKVL